LNPKDKLKSAEQLADTILGGYEFLHQFAEKAASFPEEKLAEAVQSGDLDPSVAIEMPDGSSITAIEHFEDHNKTVKKVMKYDPEFNDEVKPVLTRVLAKRDWGMTDEQWLLFKFGQDIASKGAATIMLKKQANQILSAFISLSAKQGSANNSQAPQQSEAVSPDSITRQEKEPVAKKEVEVTDIEEEFEVTQDVEQIED